MQSMLKGILLPVLLAAAAADQWSCNGPAQFICTSLGISITPKIPDDCPVIF